MRYYFSTLLDTGFGEALNLTRDALKDEGFGVITEIDMQKTLKNKIGAEFRPYVILGACNPALAHQALQLEDKVGTMLPCNVIVQQFGDRVEVAAIDPVASMQAIDNAQLGDKAQAVAAKLKAAIDRLGGTRRSEAEEHQAEIEREADRSRRELDSVAAPGSDPLHEGP